MIVAAPPKKIQTCEQPARAGDSVTDVTMSPLIENLGLFVIWSTASRYLDQIIDDLESQFRLLRIDSVHWTPALVMENYRRFYCDLPVRGVYHQFNKGAEPFTAVTLWDENPMFAARMTSRGERTVNAHFTDSKNRYRDLTGGLGIHCAETPWETARDLTMLFGANAYRELSDWTMPPGPERRTLQLDISGALGWDSKAELFRTLSWAVRYVCVEDTVSMSDETTDGPIPQLLTDDYVSLHAVVNPLRPLYRPPFGGTFALNVAGAAYPVGLRFVDDGYFDPVWARHMLECREADEHGVFRPPEPDRFYSALFEACVRKPGGMRKSLRGRTEIRESSDTPPELDDPRRAAAELMRFLSSESYECTRPKDSTAAHNAWPEKRRAGAPWLRLHRLAAEAMRFFEARAVHTYLTSRDVILSRAAWLRNAKRTAVALAKVHRSLLQSPRCRAWIREWLLAVRGLCFIGRRYKCPCCGWRIRGFMDRHGWSVRNTDGYCPRCNAKARHRRIWLYLRERTELFGNGLRVLEVGPAPTFATLLSRRRDIDYVSADLDPKMPHLSVAGDVRALPFKTGSFDAVLCQHVLEHVVEDRDSIAEIRRVVKEDGWALISVPILLDKPTHEDASITDPDERTRLFGEPGHVRMYGRDLAERLAEPGFTVFLDGAATLTDEACRRYGLRRDEHLFLCRPACPDGSARTPL